MTSQTRCRIPYESDKHDITALASAKVTPSHPPKNFSRKSGPACQQRRYNYFTEAEICSFRSQVMAPPPKQKIQCGERQIYNCAGKRKGDPIPSPQKLFPKKWARLPTA
eukprot:sb/3477344/